MVNRQLSIILLLFLLLMQQGVSAQQGGGALPSETLTQIASADKCTVYSFNYPSVDAQGEPIVLSSALFAWTPSDRQETDSIESLHIYCHITITADYARPSTTERFSQEQGLLEVLPGRTYGSGGSADYVGRCIVIAPDYEGYGITKDLPHPYLSQRTTAQQVLDAVRYGLMLYEKTVSEGTIDLLPMKSDWRSFCMGYSQGGAVSLATQRLIEEGGYADELRFQGSICGDGPYDLINTLLFYMEDDGTSYGVQTPHRKGLVTYPVVMPLIMKGMCDSHPALVSYKYEDFLSQQILDTGVLGWIDSKAYSADDISKKWYNQLQEGLDTLDRHYTPEQMAELFESPSSGKVWGKMEKMFTKDVYDYFSDPSNFHHVPEHPVNAAQALHVALADNAVSTGWEPQHRIQFFHSKCDIIVPYGNYLVFQGAHPLCRDMYSLDDTFSEGDHFDAGTTFLVNLLAARLYGDVFNWICSDPTGIRTVQGEGLMFNGEWSMFNGEWSILNGEWSMFNGEWFDLNGRRLNGKPTKKGIYIHKGRKSLIP